MNFDKASNAIVTVTGFYADALATVTAERDDALAVRDMVAKELQATQAREWTTRRMIGEGSNWIGLALVILEAVDVAEESFAPDGPIPDVELLMKSMREWIDKTAKQFESTSNV